ncbi:MAG: ATP-dependent helicase, partial [Bacteroidales bacterium]|nr:ATP-dependent helicase [Bacteroidales bacterium]
ISDEMKKSPFANFIARQVKGYALDFDDLTNFTSYILDRFEDARVKWQSELNYIMVDEAQDCNADDWNIIEKLSAYHNNLFIVGDPDQAIYEWRGSKPDRFVNFASDKDIVLDENYRSTLKILDVANCVIANNKNRIPKDLFTRKEEGQVVIHYHGKTEKQEMEWVVKQISTLLEKGGARLSDFAILYRSTYLSRAIEQQLMAAHLDYTIWGGTRFFERKEIKDSISYLRLIANQEDDLAFERILNEPSRKLGKVFLSNLKARAFESNRSLYNTLKASIDVPDIGKKGAVEFVELIEDLIEYAKTSSISDLLNRALDKSGLKQMLRDDQDEDRLENIDELLSSIQFYEEVHKEDEISLETYLQDIALYTNQDYRKDTPTIKMMTIHQAKGLEFPYVFVIGLSEGIFPSMKTIRQYKKNGEEEERRLMYVAITRAERALFLTESEGFNVSTKMGKYPSRFLAEIKRTMFVTEGHMPEELWKGTRNLIHVLDEDTFMADDEFDNIETPDGEPAVKPEDPYHVGVPVSHIIFGTGVIIEADKDGTTFTVKFDKNGAERKLRKNFLKLADLPE